MEEDKTNKTKYNIKKHKYNLDGIHASKRKMEFYKKKRARKRATNTFFMFRSLIKCVLVVLIFYLCSKIMVGNFWYLPQEMFNSPNNKNLKIIGNSITPENKILEALKKNPIPNKPIYLIGTTDYEKEVQKLSPVKKAFVRRYIFPARFEVTIEEKIPIITIAPNPTAPEIAAITKDSSVISKEFLPIKSKKYKTFKILTYDDYKNWSKVELSSLYLLSQRIEDFSGEKILYLDIRNKNDVYIQLETVKIRIGELNSTLKERLTRLSSIMPQIENLKRQTDYVDLRWDNSTYLKKKSKDSLHIIHSNISEDKKINETNVQTKQNETIKKDLSEKHTIKTNQTLNNKTNSSNKTITKTKIKQQNIDDIPKINIQTVE